MASPFTITVPSNTIVLNDKRQAQVTFTVTNLSGRPVRGRAQLKADRAEAQAWLKLDDDAEREFAIAETKQYVVRIAVPADAPAGFSPFRFDTVGLDNPDENFTQGPTVTFQVPAPQPASRPFPWWILLIVLVLLCVAGAGAAALLLSRTSDSSSVSPTPGPTPAGSGATPQPRQLKLGDNQSVDLDTGKINGTNTDLTLAVKSDLLRTDRFLVFNFGGAVEPATVDRLDACRNALRAPVKELAVETLGRGSRVCVETSNKRIAEITLIQADPPTVPAGAVVIDVSVLGE